MQTGFKLTQDSTWNKGTINAYCTNFDYTTVKINDSFYEVVVCMENDPFFKAMLHTSGQFRYTFSNPNTCGTAIEKDIVQLNVTMKNSIPIPFLMTV